MKVRTPLFLLETCARYALPKIYVSCAAADCNVRKNCARRWENDFQRLLMTFFMCNLQEGAAHVESGLPHGHDV